MSGAIERKNLIEILASFQKRIGNLETKGIANRRLIVAVGTTFVKNIDFDDIQTAIDYVETNGGGIVLIKNGTHTQVADITIPVGVVLMGETKDGAIIDFDSDAFQVLSTANNVIIRDLTIQDSTDANGGLYLSGSDDCVIRDCVVTGCTNDGIKLSNSDNVMIHFNKVTGNGAYGINVSNATCDDSIITNNNLKDNISGAINDAGTGTISANNQT